MNICTGGTFVKKKLRGGGDVRVLKSIKMIFKDMIYQLLLLNYDKLTMSFARF